jgi:dolichyl-phosphate-mannose--protein O-mannosyl transferase
VTTALFALLVGLLVFVGAFVFWAALADRSDVQKFTARTWTALSASLLFGVAFSSIAVATVWEGAL